jgi:DNA adenine methylase
MSRPTCQRSFQIDLADDLRNRNTGKELSRKVCMSGVATLTGRIRGRVRYSQARNTPFQGLAADGAALALFALAKEGFRVVGFVHDEVLVELPDEGGHVSKAVVDQIEQILVREMEKVLGGLPAGVESALTTRWSKEAKYIVEGDRVLPWRPKEKPSPLPSARADDQTHNGMVLVPSSPSPPVPPPTLPPATIALPPALPDRSRREVTLADCRGQATNLSPFLKYHGSKTELAQEFIDLMPPHNKFIDAFAGSGAVLLGKTRVAMECLNDLNPILINCFTIIQNPNTFEAFRATARSLLGPAPPPLPGEPDAVKELWQTAVARLPNEQDPILRAVYYFIKHRLSMSGRGRGAAGPPRDGRLRRGMDERRSSYLTALDNLSATHRRLQDVCLSCRPAIDVIREWDAPDATIYVDPPYVPGTRAGRKVYEFEMDEAAHRELLDVLRKAKSWVLLSGYANPLYDKKLADWARYEVDVANHGASGQTKRRMTEVLWCNFHFVIQRAGA